MSNYLLTLDELKLNYYDVTDTNSVVKYAKKLLNNTLRSHLSYEQLNLLNDSKGDFGNLLEAAYFHVKNNNESRPDIPESGIEIKSGQTTVGKKNKEVAKERLKISMIDYLSGFESNSLEESFLWPKLEKILLLLFRRESSPLRIDQICVYSDLLVWTQDELKQMSEDWLLIKTMVSSGRANELSEGKTWYLGACTAGAAGSYRKAPNCVMAKTRAFSLKNSYLNFKLGYTSKINGPKVILQPTVGQTLDTFILSNMSNFFNKPLDQVASMIKRPELSESFAKNMKSKVARALLEEITGKHTNDISSYFLQFKKAGVIEKAVTLEENGKLIESISFPAFRWTVLNDEVEWEESDLYSILTSKFFFTVFQKTATTMPLLVGSFFWTMPNNDLESMKQLWIDTKHKINDGDYCHFIKKTEHLVGHVRPHAQNALDTYPTPQGGNETKKSFWLNNEYVENVIIKELRL